MSGHIFIPLWPELEPIIAARQPHRHMPRAGIDHWLGPLHSPLREDGNPSFSVKPDSETDPGGFIDHGTGDKGSIAELARRLGVEIPHGSPGGGDGGRPATPGELLARFCRARKLDQAQLVTQFGIQATAHRGRPAIAYTTSLGIGRLKFLDSKKPKYQWQGRGGTAHWYGFAHALGPAAGNADQDLVRLVNGEVSVWACAQEGVPAVCLAAGEGTTPTPELVADLARLFHKVDVIYDLDAAGRKGAHTVVEALRAGGLEARALELPAELGQGGDVDDLHQRVGAGLAAALAALPELPPLPVEVLPFPDRPQAFLPTDGGNAERFAAEHQHDVRYCFPRSVWFVWNGQRYAIDDRGEAQRRAKATARAMLAEAIAESDDERRKARVRHAMATDSRARRDAMIALAASEPGLAVLPEELDRDPWLLNVANGVIDLHTGELRPHRREDLITNLAPVVYDPGATAPRWQHFLEEVIPDPEVRTFAQKAIGYSLTGDVSEQVLFFLHGSGSNGKSVFLAAVLAVLGDYAVQVAPDLLMARQGERHPTELTDLYGKRLVTTIEAEEGHRFAEGLLKWITGGDRIRARRMRENNFEWTPTHKLILAANHRPTIRGTDLAIWRRIRLLPFTMVIPEERRDLHLVDKLKTEAPGILRWAVEGCLAWQREGLKAPAAVLAATSDYRSEQDVVGRFLETRCFALPETQVAAGTLYKAFRAWCAETGEREFSQQLFGRRLSDRGLVSQHRRSGYYWRGINLLAAEPMFPPDAEGVTDVTDVNHFSGKRESENSHTRESEKRCESITSVTGDREPGEDDDSGEERL
jgi:putative DNA primase/helicase